MDDYDDIEIPEWVEREFDAAIQDVFADSTIVPEGTLLLGMVTGFSPDTAQAILSDEQSLAYIDERLSRHEHLNGSKALPLGLKTRIDRERVAGGDQWTLKVVQASGHGRTAEEINAELSGASLRLVLRQTEPVQSDLALAAGPDAGPKVWDPSKWEQVWSHSDGGFIVGTKLDDQNLFVGLYSSTQEGFFDLTFTWPDGHIQTIPEVEASPGETMDYPKPIHCTETISPINVTIQIHR